MITNVRGATTTSTRPVGVERLLGRTVTHHAAGAGLLESLTVGRRTASIDRRSRPDRDARSTAGVGSRALPPARSLLSRSRSDPRSSILRRLHPPGAVALDRQHRARARDRPRAASSTRASASELLITCRWRTALGHSASSGSRLRGDVRPARVDSATGRPAQIEATQSKASNCTCVRPRPSS
jgi:hypothetical protein